MQPSQGAARVITDILTPLNPTLTNGAGRACAPILTETADSVRHGMKPAVWHGGEMTRYYRGEMIGSIDREFVTSAKNFANFNEFSEIKKKS